MENPLQDELDKIHGCVIIVIEHDVPHARTFRLNLIFFLPDLEIRLDHSRGRSCRNRFWTPAAASLVWSSWPDFRPTAASRLRPPATLGNIEENQISFAEARQHGLFKARNVEDASVFAIFENRGPGDEVARQRCARIGACLEKKRLLDELRAEKERSEVQIDRDRGTSRDATPPPPPGIRVRTTAVRLG